MKGNPILSGGVAHDSARTRTSPMLADILSEAGNCSEIHDDFDVMEDGSLQQFYLLTLNCVRWTCDRTTLR